VCLKCFNFDLFQWNDKTCKSHQCIRFGVFVKKVGEFFWKIWDVCKISWKLKAWDFDVGQNIKNVQKNYYYNYVRCSSRKRCKNLSVLTTIKICIVAILKGKKSRHFMAMLEYFLKKCLHFLILVLVFVFLVLWLLLCFELVETAIGRKISTCKQRFPLLITFNIFL